TGTCSTAWPTTSGTAPGWSPARTGTGPSGCGWRTRTGREAAGSAGLGPRRGVAGSGVPTCGAGSLPGPRHDRDGPRVDPDHVRLVRLARQHGGDVVLDGVLDGDVVPRALRH